MFLGKSQIFNSFEYVYVCVKLLFLLHLCSLDKDILNDLKDLLIY